MPNLLIIAKESKELAGLSSGLIRNGFVCSIIPHGNGFVEEITAHRPNLVMMEMDGYSANSEIQELMQSMKQENSLPLIALIAKEKLDDINGHLYVDDFATSPYSVKELVLRVKRLLNGTSNMDSSELIKCDGLVIDLAKCEVTVEGKIVELTFKEYESSYWQATEGVSTPVKSYLTESGATITTVATGQWMCMYGDSEARLRTQPIRSLRR